MIHLPNPYEPKITRVPWREILGATAIALTVTFGFVCAATGMQSDWRGKVVEGLDEADARIEQLEQDREQLLATQLGLLDMVAARNDRIAELERPAGPRLLIIDNQHLSPTVYAELAELYPIETSHNFTASSWGFRRKASGVYVANELTVDTAVFREALDRRVPDRGPRAYLWIDAEGPYATTDDLVVGDLLLLAELIAAERPLAQVGFYNPVAVATHSDRIVHWDPRIVASPATSTIGPRTYDSYPDRAPTHRDVQTKHVHRAVLRSREVAGEREVIAFVMHRYVGAGHDLVGEPIAIGEFRATVRAALAAGADGIAWFGVRTPDEEALLYGKAIIDELAMDRPASEVTGNESRPDEPAREVNPPPGGE